MRVPDDIDAHALMRSCLRSDGNADALMRGMRQWLEVQFLPIAELTPVQADQRLQAIIAKLKGLAKQLEEATEWNHRGQILMDLIGVMTHDVIQALAQSEDQNMHAAIHATVDSFIARLNELNKMLYLVDVKDFVTIWSFVGLRSILRDSSGVMDIDPMVSPVGDAIRFYRDVVKLDVREAIIAWDRSIDLALKFSNQFYFDNTMAAWTEVLHATSRWNKDDDVDALQIVRSALKTAYDSSILQVYLFIWFLAKKDAHPLMEEAQLDAVYAQAPALCASLGLEYPFHSDLQQVQAALARSASVVREGQITFRGNTAEGPYELTMSVVEFFYTAYYHVVFSAHSMHAFHVALMEHANDKGRLGEVWERMCSAVPGLAELARADDPVVQNPSISAGEESLPKKAISEPTTPTAKTTERKTAPPRHIVNVAEIKGQVSFAAITVREDEYVAVLKRFPSKQLVQGNRLYSLSWIEIADGTDCLVACAPCIEQGEGSAYDVARDMIEDLDPDVILLIGIAGAVPDDDFSLGDVVIAKRVHDFSVRAVLKDGDEQVMNQGGPMHKQVQNVLAQLPALQAHLGDWNSPEKIGRAKPNLDLEAIEAYGGDEWERKVRDSLRLHFNPQSASRPPHVTSRSVGSGNLLVKNAETLKNWQTYSREVASVEMELGGVYNAARRIDWEYPIFAVRGISDVVGLKRNPAWTQYACDTAASCAFALVLTYAKLFPRASDPHAPVPGTAVQVPVQTPANSERNELRAKLSQGVRLFFDSIDLDDVILYHAITSHGTVQEQRVDGIVVSMDEMQYGTITRGMGGKGGIFSIRGKTRAQRLLIPWKAIDDALADLDQENLIQVSLWKTLRFDIDTDRWLLR